MPTPISLMPDIQLLESLRSLGYELNSAIADIVDNSLDAEAGLIEIDIDVVNGHYVAVLDDGVGMGLEKLTEALRLAASGGNIESVSDSNIRSRLGKFGMGLKTASISQARRLTVISKTSAGVNAIQLDLDALLSSQSWNGQQFTVDEIRDYPLAHKILAANRGTLVIWENLDKLLQEVKSPGIFLQEKLPPLVAHLALTFHRLIGINGSQPKIEVNGLIVEPFDPFLEKNKKTQSSREDIFVLSDCQIKYTTFTLPGSKNLTPQERDRPDLSDQISDWQGFYFYRHGRLISREGWQKVTKSSKLSQNTRVRVDLPGGLDSQVGIEITKSFLTSLPKGFAQHMRDRMPFIQEASRRIHTFRGRRVDESVGNLWNKIKSLDNGFRYEVNFDNPYLKQFLGSYEDEVAKPFQRVLTVLQDAFPYRDASWEFAQNNVPTPKQSDVGELRSQLLALKASGINGTAEALQFVKYTEPFSLHEREVLVDLVEQIWGEE